MRRAFTLLVAVAALGAACGSAPVAVTTSTTAVSATTITTTTLPPRPETARAAGLPWWNDRVFYEMFVRSFADSDGDGIGDLQGAIDRLDYLNDGNPATHDDLGVTGIWLMPVFESPSYHGYDVTDYRTVESDYGTNEDLKAFVAAAHRRGMVVILDLVINHTSVEHPWFTASASGEADYADWYVWSDDDPGFSGPDGQQVWYRQGGRFYYALFWEGMPDLDLENPSVTAEITDIARFWIEEAGVDGYRIDAARHLVEDGAIQVDTPATLAWLEAFRVTLPADTLVLGEVWAPAEIVANYLPDALDLAFEFDLANATVQGVAGADAGAVADSLERVAGLYPNGQHAVFLSNHDQ
ncbi:MAG: alpha-amylase, partial [Actinobacteria bacterium]|nr:alpha-amylase [Actinomycetota bacterium]